MKIAPFVLAVLFPLQGWAQEKIYYGSLKSIDAANGTITIQPRELNQPKTLNLFKKDLPITDVYGQKLKLEDLKVKSRLALTTKDDDVLSICDESNYEWGVTIGYDLDKKEYVARFGNGVHKIKDTPELAVFHHEEKASLADFKPKQSVRVTLSPDRSKPIEIRYGKVSVNGNPYAKVVNHSGFLLKKDAQKKTVMVALIGERHEAFDLHYDAWTSVRLFYSTYLLGYAKMEDVNPYCRINFYYEIDRERLTSLNVDVPIISRHRVAAIDHAKRTITIVTNEEGKKETFPVSADVRVLNDTNAGNWTDAKEKSLVTVGLSLDQKEVIFLSIHEK